MPPLDLFAEEHQAREADRIRMDLFSKQTGIPRDRFGLYEGQVVYQGEDGNLYHPKPLDLSVYLSRMTVAESTVPNLANSSFNPSSVVLKDNPPTYNFRAIAVSFLLEKYFKT